MKRYDFHTEWGHGEVVEWCDGEYVKFEDHEAVVKQLRAQIDALDKVAMTYHDAYYQATGGWK
jgi:adenine-specific DNA methylase